MQTWEVYEGQIIGIHSRSNELNCKLLQVKTTNMRASGKDDAVCTATPGKIQS